jgi:Holliday junction resolvase RusA-like endonuclease
MTASTALDRKSSISEGTETPRASLKSAGSRGLPAPATQPYASTVIYLPFPPSNNNLYANRKGGGGRFPSSRYQSWKRVADTEFLAQKRGLRKLRGPVNVWIYLEDRDKRTKDADNFSKAAIDFCVAQKIIERDDKSIVRSVHLIWSHDTTGCMVSIWPAPISAEG